MVVLYFSCNFDVVVQGGELCLTMLPSCPEVSYPFMQFLCHFMKFKVKRGINKCMYLATLNGSIVQPTHRFNNLPRLQ